MKGTHGVEATKVRIHSYSPARVDRGTRSSRRGPLAEESAHALHVASEGRVAQGAVDLAFGWPGSQ